jgi:hypothetical protein
MSKFISILLIFTFVCSGFYNLPLFTYSQIIYIKALLYSSIIILAMFVINFRETFKQKFSIFLFIIALIFLLNYLFRNEYLFEYAKRIFELIFIYILINFLIQKKNIYRYFVNFFHPLAIFILFFIVLLFFYFNQSFAILLLQGFGNGPIGFSLWMLQFIFLVFLRKHLSKKD